MSQLDVSARFPHLSPIIITYNRAAFLENTLQAFCRAGLADRLQILDNASTDSTPEIARRFQGEFPCILYHRNKINIGGNANILRSVEFSESDYHWVVGDDDEWTFNESSLRELQSVLEKGEADIIRLGWLVSDESRGKLLDAKALAQSENLFFASISMISATITRRSLITRALPYAYQNICDSYPQLVPPMRAIEEMPLKVYTLSTNLMTHTPSNIPGYFHGDLEWFAGWFRTSRFLKDPVLRKRFVHEATLVASRNHRHPNQQFILLTKILLYFKSFGLSQRLWLLEMLLYGKGWRLRTSAMLVIDALTPVFALNLARKSWFWLRRKPQKTLRVDRSRL